MTGEILLKDSSGSGDVPSSGRQSFPGSTPCDPSPGLIFDGNM